MKHLRHTFLCAVAALGLAALSLGCDGGVRTGGPQGGGGADMRTIVTVDGGGGGGFGDSAPGGYVDAGGGFTPDRGVPGPKPDAFAPKPDTTQQQSGPTGPFGSSVGMTASNFTINDCDSKPVTLYDFWNKGKGVVLMLNKAS